MAESKIKCILSIILLIICVIGLGITDIAIYSKSKKVGTYPCPLLNPKNLTTYTATKDLWSQWNWRYDFDQFTGSIKQQCPTTNHDTVLESGTLVAYTDKKTFSIYSTNYIRDCTGEAMFITKTGSIFETIINKNKIIVSFEITDLNDNPIAYVDGTHLFVDTITLLDIYGNNIAKLYRNKIDVTWQWIFTVYNSNHDASNSIILASLAGMKSFSDIDNKYDTCNTFFWYVLYGFIVLAMLIVLTLSFAIYIIIRKYVKKSNDSNVINNRTIEIV